MNLFKQHSLLVLFSLAALFITSCQDDNTFRLNFDDAPPAYDITQAASDTTIPGGTQIYIFEEGDGPFQVVSKDQIIVEITGRTEDGQIFDSSYNNRTPVDTRPLQNLTPTPIAGQGGQPILLVEGLRKALLGMKEGSIRTIVVPPEMGYNQDYIEKTGSRGVNGFDLTDQTLTYDVKLISI